VQNDEPAKQIASARTDEAEDQKRQRDDGLPRLSRTVGRVTVILPEKK
jgi:hypothetical protein